MIEYEALNAGPPFPEDDEDDQVYALVIEPTETVPGATELLAEGFVPLGSLTGGTWVAEAWPDEHRRVMPETRAALLTDMDDGKVWFVRSPWSGISPANALALVYVSQSRTDPDVWLDEASAILRLDEVTASSRVQELGLSE